MDYRPLGRSGMQVSQLCLGAMMLGAGGNPDHEDGARIIHRALDAGINFIDTADAYGESEDVVGKALKGRRDDVVLATKVGLPLDEDPNHRGTSRRWVERAVERSLRRLQTDHIDLYQVHRLDPATGLDETLGALSDLVRAGKVRAIGVSNAAGSELVEAQWVADRRGHERFATDQPAYSMLTRAIEYDVLPTAQRLDMGVLTYRPLEAGWLSGKYRKGREVAPSGSPARRERFGAALDPASPANAAKLDAAESLALLAEEAGLTLVQLATAFAVRHPAVTSAIVGPRTMEHLEGYLEADGVELSDDLLDRIDEIVPPGHTVNVADNMWHTSTTALQPAARRRPAR
jgi:aryl-alcohol dehydrogenase-like predicted oxidoreductase